MLPFVATATFHISAALRRLPWSLSGVMIRPHQRAAVITDLSSPCVLEVALSAEVFNIGPFIRVDAARHTLLQYSGLAILVSIAKVTTWKDNRIFNLIAGDNPIDTRCFARAGFFVKVDRTRPDDLDSATKA